MAENLVKKVQSGFEVDGFDLIRSNCGCGAQLGPFYSECCHTYSTVKHEGNKISFFAKFTTPNTTENYKWGYRVKKGDTEVDVLIFDTKTKVNFEVGGRYAPPVSAWKERGWQVLDQFEKPLEEEAKAPEWCQSPEYCVRPESTLESPHGDVKRDQPRHGGKISEDPIPDIQKQELKR